MGDCSDCGQPMLPPGEKKRPNEYDHASGCPRAIKLTDAQMRALAHVVEMSRLVEGHNARWPRDRQPVGAHAGTSSLPWTMARRLIARGLVIAVETWPGDRRYGVFGITDAGREVLRPAKAIPEVGK